MLRRVQKAQVGRCITRLITTAGPSASEHEKYVETKENNGVRTIKLNHPKSYNSLSFAMMKALLNDITKNQTDQSLRSIVISSVPGKVFSAGHNLKELTCEAGKENHEKVFQTCLELMRAIVCSPVPVIAAVDGAAIAAGCQLVAACDIAICTEKSTFSTPGANVGIFCSSPGVSLVRNVQRKTAMYMLLTGFSLTGHEAFNAGLVSKVVANEKLEQEIGRITDSINAKSRAVLSMGKKFVYEQIDLDMWTAYALSTETMLNNLELKDAQEGIRSFIEKRKPQWSHDFNKTGA